ncbi:type II 3-dehydroquinate dehydratase [Rhodoflexus caldus]|uniref:type II 3-dehydroquinate dehydratase n=1 Tax=Rhodoflexus caldus TaxID=2891236 RepID=UPI00202AB748|nr:type II 3-dehydroquinate dehydratase [Rhodoflexus caldus]
MTEIIIINGPNLNLLGKREPEIYGTNTFENFFGLLQKEFSNVANISYFQSNHEGVIIDKLHEVGFSGAGIVLNAGGLTHTSVALGDAVAAIPSPVVEVHISNIHAREPFRHHSYISKYAKGVIVGCGLNGYRLAVMHLLQM